MQIKKEVLNRVTSCLQKELNKCNNTLHQNLYQFKRLAEEQTILKRERVKLTELINSLGGNK